MSLKIEWLTLVQDEINIQDRYKYHSKSTRSFHLVKTLKIEWLTLVQDEVKIQDRLKYHSKSTRSFHLVKKWPIPLKSSFELLLNKKVYLFSYIVQCSDQVMLQSSEPNAPFHFNQPVTLQYRTLSHRICHF